MSAKRRIAALERSLGGPADDPAFLALVRRVAAAEGVDADELRAEAMTIIREAERRGLSAAEFVAEYHEERG